MRGVQSIGVSGCDESFKRGTSYFGHMAIQNAMDFVGHYASGWFQKFFWHASG